MEIFLWFVALIHRSWRLEQMLTTTRGMPSWNQTNIKYINQHLSGPILLLNKSRAQAQFEWRIRNRIGYNDDWNSGLEFATRIWDLEWDWGLGVGIGIWRLDFGIDIKIEIWMWTWENGDRDWDEVGDWDSDWNWVTDGKLYSSFY